MDAVSTPNLESFARCLTREDEDSPWDHGVELSSGLPNARLVSIDGAGHSLLTANTAHVCDELLQLFEKNGNYDAT